MGDMLQLLLVMVVLVLLILAVVAVLQVLVLDVPLEPVVLGLLLLEWQPLITQEPQQVLLLLQPLDQIPL